MNQFRREHNKYLLGGGRLSLNEWLDTRKRDFITELEADLIIANNYDDRPSGIRVHTVSTPFQIYLDSNLLPFVGEVGAIDWPRHLYEDGALPHGYHTHRVYALACSLKCWSCGDRATALMQYSKCDRCLAEGEVRWGKRA